MQYAMTRIKKNTWKVAIDALDPFSDSMELYVIGYADGNNCKVTDDGYTDYNLACLGKIVSNRDKEIYAIGKWDNLDKLIEIVLQKIISAYDKYDVKTYWYKRR
ncbi:hypothetical protein F5ESL0230_04515 [Lactobacillus sp. ESL0230]|nr:hypothetical protein F5ESL0230_04515 [Lactobacillus sp. ESL0230]